MIHLIVGDKAAENLQAAFELDENLKGEVLVLKDTLGIGPIATDEKGHDGVRTTFWRQYLGEDFEGVMDKHAIQKVKEKALAAEEPVCLWMAPCVSDVCAYYFLLTQFRDAPGVFHIINIDSLPFLNDKGGVFYPKNFSEVLPKEFVKTKRLLKEVTPAHYEIDGEEWEKLQSENAMVRVYKGGKDIESADETFFDQALYLLVTKEEQRGSKIVRQALAKIDQTVSDLFLLGRLKAMHLMDRLHVLQIILQICPRLALRKGGGQEVENEELKEESE